MLISFGLPQPGPARFVLPGRIRSYTKGDLQDLFRPWTGLLPAFFTAMHSLRLCINLAAYVCAFCERSMYACAVFQMRAASTCMIYCGEQLHFIAFAMLMTKAQGLKK